MSSIVPRRLLEYSAQVGADSGLGGEVRVVWHGQPSTGFELTFGRGDRLRAVLEAVSSRGWRLTISLSNRPEPLEEWDYTTDEPYDSKEALDVASAALVQFMMNRLELPR